MPDRRRHRGPHPDDRRLFAESQLPALRAAVADYSWLLTRAYADKSALTIVGDRYGLTARQRLAVMRSGCSEQALAARHTKCQLLSESVGGALAVDGYNLLITVESALSGGVILIGRDGCHRDLAGLHGTYRRIEETEPAIVLIAKFLEEAGATRVDWFLDKPVSNSGRLKRLMAELLERREMCWNIELADNPDRVLVEHGGVVASHDSVVLDKCRRWVNLAGTLIRSRLARCWCVDLNVSLPG